MCNRSNCGIFFQELQVRERITYNLKYSWFWCISSNWSTTSKKSDWSTQYPVVTDFTNYAPTIERFIEEYPYVTIQTSGKAVSDSTFGDVGAGRFGELTFETIHFNSADYHDLPIVTSHKSHFTFNVGVNIGVGFKTEGYKLFLRPYTNGWIYSVGARWRELEFGLGVTSITFHPKSEKANFINSVNQN